MKRFFGILALCSAVCAVNAQNGVDYNVTFSTKSDTTDTSSLVTWELLSSFSLSSAGQQGIATDGNFIYACSWQSTPTGGHAFYKYDLDSHKLVEGFDIEGVSQLRDLTFDGTYFYGGTLDTNIYQLDLANKTLVSIIPTQIRTIRHCSYDPDREGFWVGNWSDLYLVDKTGKIVDTAHVQPNNVFSSVYDNHTEGGPFLWLFAQIRGDSADCVFQQYDILADTLTNVRVDLSRIMPGIPGMAGGAFGTTALVSNTFVIMANAQQDPNLVGVFKVYAKDTSESSCVQIEKRPEVSIFPNPVGAVLNVCAENCHSVQIVNSLGQVVYQAAVAENNFQINVFHLSRGVYTLRLNGETATIRKFVKK